MSDTLPEDAWVNAFLSAPPRPLQQALQKRLQASQTHIHAVAELFKQRALIESQYAESLSKLARTATQGGLNGKNSIEWDKSGGEAKLWDNMLTEIQEVSSAHSTLSAIIKTDYEQPVRDLPNKIVAWRRVGDQDASLEKSLKDYEKTSGKLDKAKKGKSDALASELNQITSNLSSLSPMVYTTYQRLDEERLRGLKEIMVRWGTTLADVAQRDAERAERAVAKTVSWETPDEVTAAGNRIAAQSGAGGRNTTSYGTPATPRSVRRMSSATAGTNDFSPRPTPRQETGASALPSSSSGTFAGGLKSMLGRRPTLGSSGRGRSDSDAPSLRNRRTENGFASINENDTEQLRDADTSRVDSEGFSMPPEDRHRNPWEEPSQADGTSSRNVPQPGVGTPLDTGFSQGFTSSPVPSNDDLLTGDDSSLNQGKSKLNLAMTSAPIMESEADRQAAMEKMQQTLQATPLQQPTRRATNARGRRDVRNTVFAPANGESPAQNDFMAPLSPPIDSSPSMSFGMPRSASNANSFIAGAPTTLARQVSASSIGSNNPFDSPGLPTRSQIPSGSGLRAAISETINVLIRDKTVRRLQINGEIHLSLRGSDAQPLQGPIHLRLQQFEALEKIAPNPAYLKQVPDTPGEYFLDSQTLAEASKKPGGGEKGVVLFKYQVHFTPGSEMSLLPLSIKPSFLCKEGETRMILHYGNNPDYRAKAPMLSDLTLAAAFAPGPSVKNVQAKPTDGVWAPSSRRMTWNIGSSSSDEGKIIARFVSEGEGSMSPQGVQATWRMDDTLVSGLDLEVVEGDLESNWTFSEVKKGTISGKYLSEPVLN